MPIFNGKFLTKFDVLLPVTILVCLSPLAVVKFGGAPKTQSTTGGAYITLVTSEQTQDKAVAEKLSAAGIKNTLSESSQWFFVNDFTELRRVPLDEFSGFLLESDPRNDGYAQKLRTLFVRDGRRYFYIPRSSIHSQNPAVIEQYIKTALEDTPYVSIMSSAYSRQNSNWSFIFIMSAILSLALLIRVQKSFSKPAGNHPAAVETRVNFALPLLFAAVLPACVLFASQGPAGFALILIMLNLFHNFRSPVTSVFIKLRLDRKSVFSISFIEYTKQYLSKEKKYALAAFTLFLVVCVTGKINLFYALLGIFFFCLSSAVSIWRETAPAGGRNAPHVRFVPISIKPHPEIKRRLRFTTLPFAAAAAAVLALPLFIQPQVKIIPINDGKKFEVPAIGVNDYEQHINFQKTFAFKKLTYIDGDTDATVYNNFEIGSDGLLCTIDVRASFEIEYGGIPPFPLEKLLAFLNQKDEILIQPDFDLRGLAAILIALIVYFPSSILAMSGNGKKAGNRLYMSQRITA
ncbi:MAG: hypothetical protein LBB22_02820 [Treponema sp.]|jgi:hypothetical protein|nr:hypothetical protein [Treponema sp.]